MEGRVEEMAGGRNNRIFGEELFKSLPEHRHKGLHFYPQTTESFMSSLLDSYSITVPVLPFRASFRVSKEVIRALLPSFFSMNPTDAWNFGSML